ncbi:MAG: MATE family efflux transporter [Oscillospiraceae bacterium]|nr:MATE family efflux transporter [Oscillospiraceae bacterium]
MLKREKRLRQDLCQGPFLPKIISYTIPIILTSVLQLLFNAADLMVLGQLKGNDNVGAVGATSSLINLLVSLFTGLSIGAGVCVAQGIGARDDERVSRAVHTAIPAAAIGGAVLTVVGVCLSRWFLELMATPANLLGQATLYMQIYFAGIIPILVYNFGAAILRSAGDTKSPLIYLSAAGVLNILLNLFLVAVCDMAVDGVALATVISQLLACVLVLRKLMCRGDSCKLSLKKMRIDPRALGRIVSIGLPAGIQGSLFSISNVTIQSSVNSFNIEAINNGCSAASNIEGFVYMGMNAFQQTVTTFVGQNSGARKYKNVGRVVGLTLACVTVTGLILGSAARLFAPQLLSLYLKEGGEAIRYGITRMNYVCSVYFLCGIMDVLSGSLRGMGASTVPMVVSILGACGLRVLWVVTVFRQYQTLDSLFVVFPVSWIVTILALVVCFVIVWKKRIEAVGAQ